jgi:hypothetical protein
MAQQPAEDTVMTFVELQNAVRAMQPGMTVTIQTTANVIYVGKVVENTGEVHIECSMSNAKVKRGEQFIFPFPREEVVEVAIDNKDRIVGSRKRERSDNPATEGQTSDKFTQLLAEAVNRFSKAQEKEQGNDWLGTDGKQQLVIIVPSLESPSDCTKYTAQWTHKLKYVNQAADPMTVAAYQAFDIVARNMSMFEYNSVVDTWVLKWQSNICSRKGCTVDYEQQLQLMRLAETIKATRARMLLVAKVKATDPKDSNEAVVHNQNACLMASEMLAYEAAIRDFYEFIYIRTHPTEAGAVSKFTHRWMEARRRENQLVNFFIDYGCVIDGDKAQSMSRGMVSAFRNFVK